MPGRSFNGNGYRYGMNGQEKDNEIANGIYTAEYWEYDSRLGRRWNIDPVTKPWESPYACFSNNPIYYVDIKGLTATDPPPKEGQVQICEDGNQEVYAKGSWNQYYSLPEVTVTADRVAPPQLLAVATGNASPEKTIQHAEFSVEAYGGGGGAFGVGGEVAVKHFQMIPNVHTKNHLYKDESFLMFDLDGKGGSNGTGVSAEWGDGYLLDTDPWEPYSKQIAGVSDYDMGAGASFISVTTTNEVTLGVSRLHYTTMGVGLGFIEKVESPFTVAGGFNTTVSFSEPSFYDSVKTAIAFPNHPKSRAFIQNLGQRKIQRGKAQKILD